MQSGLVKAAVVLVREAGSGSKQLVGYVVPQQQPANKTALIAYLQQHLPDYMVPSVWVELEQLPLTQNGKIDKKALPKAEPTTPDRPYVAPQTETEKKLSEIWKQILHLEQVGVQDNFFELGGHSLLAMRVIAAIRKELQTESNIKDLFQFNTIESLSRYIAVQATAHAEEDSSKFEILNI